MITGLMPGGPAFWNYMEERWYPKSCDDIWTVIAKDIKGTLEGLSHGPTNLGITIPLELGAR
jgi:hypothetical protein